MLVYKDLNPIAVFISPVLLLRNAEMPIAVLLVPAVKGFKASNPKEVLSKPKSPARILLRLKTTSKLLVEPIKAVAVTVFPVNCQFAVLAPAIAIHVVVGLFQ